MDRTSTPQRVVVLDTETTGLSASSRIVEFAALEVDPRTGRTGRRLHHVIDPQVPIPAVVTRIHGIGKRDVAGKPTFAGVASEIGAFLSGATLVIQNASFDYRVLEAELARASRPSLAVLGTRVVDTVAVSRGLFPLAEGHSLDRICDRLGVDRSCRTQHGALVDAELVAYSLPRFAAAYDAWCAAGEPDASNDLDRLGRELKLLCDDLAAEADASTPQRADRAFARLAAASASLLHAEETLMDLLATGVAPCGWCSKHAAARWSLSEVVSFKSVAAAYLTADDLAPFRTETRIEFLTARAAGADDLARLERTRGALLEATQTAPPAGIARLTLACREARKRLESLRADLRAALLRFAREGYRLRHAGFDERNVKRTDYRAALAHVAPDVDLGPFTTQHRRLSVRARDLGPCGVLFGDSNLRAQSGPGTRVA